MTYEEIYREIKYDYPGLHDAIAKDALDFIQKAKRTRKFPFGKMYCWTHPKSKNEYSYFFEVKRHSDWDKNPRLVIYTEYEGSDGKATIIVAEQLTKKIGISICSPHFFQRYYERNVSRIITKETEDDAKLAFLIRTTTGIPLGTQVLSRKEIEKEEADFVKDSLLTTEGLIMCYRWKANRNIVLFKTYVSLNDLFDDQSEKVSRYLLGVVHDRAISDSPRYKKSIDDIYENGISEVNSLFLNNTFSAEEKQDMCAKRYLEVLKELNKFII